MKHAVLALLLLLTFSACGSPVDGTSRPGSMVGTYLNSEAGSDSYLSLSQEGKGAILTGKKDGTITQTMAFNWHTIGDSFYQTSIHFSTDQKRILKTKDSEFKFKMEGETLLSLNPSKDTWIRWERVSEAPNQVILDMILFD